MTPLQLEADVLHILLKGLALSVALLALAFVFLRRCSAHTSSLFWRAGLTGLLAIPAISVWLPWLKLEQPRSTASSPPAALESVQPPPTAPADAAPIVTGLSTEAALSNEVALREIAPSPAMESQPTPRSSIWTGWRPHLVVGLWLVGALAVIGRWLWSWFRVRGLVSRAAACNDPNWSGEISRLGTDGKPVRLLVSREAQAPMVCGLVRPVIVLPREAHEWPAERRRQILAHELSHIRRCDPAWLLVARVAVALHWANPLAWLAAKRLRLADEQCADDAVLQDGGDPAEYASLLASFARNSITTPHRHSAVAPSMTGASTLRSRVQRVLDGKRRRGAPRRTTRIALGSLVAGLVAVAGGLSVAPADAQEKEKGGGEPAQWEGPTVLEGSDETLLKARKIVLPTVDFDNTTLGDVVDYLRSRSRELDTFELDPTKKGLNFVVLDAELKQRRVPRLLLRNVSIATVLEFVCRQTGTTFEIGPHALTIIARRDDGVAPAQVEPARHAKEAEGPVMQKLWSIVIPEVEFHDATLADAVEFLHRKSQELDVREKDPSRKGVNFVIKGRDLGARRIEDLAVKDVAINLILHYVCSQSSTNFQVDDLAVTIVDELVTRTWDVPPIFPQELETKFQNRENPFEVPGEREAARPLIETLRGLGIGFQAGATAIYNPQPSQLVVRARPANLKLVDDLIREMFWPAPMMVKVQVELYEVPKAEALAIVKADAGRSEGSEAYQSAKKLVDRGQASLLMVRSAMARPGQRTETQSGSELQHVSAYEEKDGKDVPVMTTTLVGSRIEVEPNMGPNPQLLDVRYSLYFTRGEPERFKSVVKAPVSGRELEVENVVIETLTLSQGIATLDGQTQLLGTMQSSSDVEDDNEILAFLTATVSKVRR